jgi:RNA-directed DNA polymerase
MKSFNLNFNKRATVNSAEFKKNFIKSKDCEIIIKLRELSKLNHQNIPYKNIIFIISDIELLKIAYQSIDVNLRASLKSTNSCSFESLDSDWFEKTADLLKRGQFKFNIFRCPEVNLIISTKFFSLEDIIVQKAIFLVLEAIYDPTFRCHAFDYKTSTNNYELFKQIKKNFKSIKWVYTADFSKFKETFDHQILISILKEKLHCVKTIALIKSALTCGYFCEGVIRRFKIGATSASTLSSIFFHIYFSKLDLYLSSLNRTSESRVSKRVSSFKLTNKFKTKKNTFGRTLLKKQFQFFNNFTFRNIRKFSFVKYADTYLIGTSKNRPDAIFFLKKIEAFSKKVLKIHFKFAKSKLISFAKTKVFFLGCLIRGVGIPLVYSCNLSPCFFKRIIRVNSQVSFYAPVKILLETLVLKNFFKKVNNKFLPVSLKNSINLTHQEIIQTYNQIINGLLNYYSFVKNKKSLRSIIQGLKMSAARTLALKYKYRSVAPVFKKFGKKLKCLYSSFEISTFTNFVKNGV